MNSMYTAEQINIPPELGTILKQYTKACIRERPQNLYQFSANFFASLSGQMPPFDQSGKLVYDDDDDTLEKPNSTNGIADAVQGVDKKKNDMIDEKEQPTLTADLVEKLFNQYDSTNSGEVDISELQFMVRDLGEVLGFSEEQMQMNDETVQQKIQEEGSHTIDLDEFTQLCIYITSIM
eukprot:Tbor_TRINITY_DN3484_c0_g1::TRINITY_DN3484_c0_g1_i1::g.3713::m.3713